MEFFSELETALAAAPFDVEGWKPCLRHVRTLSNARLCQFLNWSDARGSASIDFSEDVSGLERLWQDLRCDDPKDNPIIARGLRVGPGTTFTDDQVLDLEDRGANRVWREFYLPLDMPHQSTNVLSRAGRGSSCLTVIRSENEGVFTSGDFAIQTGIALRWRRAVLLMEALRDDSDQILKGGLEAMNAAAFALDAHGRVRVVTAAAEMLVRQGDFRLAAGTLVAQSTSANVALGSGVAACRRLRRPQHFEISISEHRRLRIAISSLPERRIDLGWGPLTLIVCQPTRTLPGLSSAEMDVAHALISGQRLSEIAATRQRALETVKGQAKSIYAKLGVSGQIDLMATWGQTPN